MNAFIGTFRREPEVRGRAPGRVNLIGEHTDYNGGYVLPVTIPRHTLVTLAARDDDRVRVASTAFGGREAAEYRLGHEAQHHDWRDYVAGVTHVLGQDGQRLTGFDALVESDLPIGAGLASSAALLVALQRALRERFTLALDDLDIARNARRVENDFVGARVGIMDPMIASLGRPGQALCIDTHDLALRHIPMPATIELVVVDSGIAHRHAAGEYNRRRDECDRAARALGVSRLSELRPAALARAARLPEPLGRRVRHVVTENRRVLRVVAALDAQNLEGIGAAMAESHASLRDDYQVSVPAIDRLVEALAAEPGVLGARMTGGGFGGAVVALARAGSGFEAARRSAARSARATGEPATVIVPAANSAFPAVEARAHATPQAPRAAP